MNGDLRERVRQVILDHIDIDPGNPPREDDSLLGLGVLNSIGFIALIACLEKQFNVRFQDEELAAENIDSIARLTDFVVHKLM